MSSTTDPGRRKAKHQRLKKESLIYVAGPYRSELEWGIEQNIRRAEQVGNELLEAGYYPYVPHKNTARLGGLFDDEVFLKHGLAFLPVCHGVVLVSGWERSSGTYGEVKLAFGLNIPVYENTGTLIAGLCLVDEDVFSRFELDDRDEAA